MDGGHEMWFLKNAIINVVNMYLKANGKGSLLEAGEWLNTFVGERIG